MKNFSMNGCGVVPEALISGRNQKKVVPEEKNRYNTCPPKWDAGVPRQVCWAKGNV